LVGELVAELQVGPATERRNCRNAERARRRFSTTTGQTGVNRRNSNVESKGLAYHRT